MSFLLLVSFIVGGCAATTTSADLTARDFETGLKGQSLFVVFHAPWCGHCKALMPAWKKVAEEAVDKEFLTMARVDCTTTENKAICSKYNIKGFPTMLHGTVDELEAYQGGRDEESIRSFMHGMKPICSIYHSDSCTAEEIAILTELQNLDASQLKDRVRRFEESVYRVETQYQSDVKTLQESYRNMTEKKTEQIARLRQESNIAMVKSVLST